MPTTVAVDWDGVLVDPVTQEWMPGAQAALSFLMVNFKHDVIIHSCRANWDEALSQLETRMREIPQPTVTPPGKQRPRRWTIHSDRGKPYADWYVDNHAVVWVGWPDTLEFLRPREGHVYARPPA